MKQNKDLKKNKDMWKRKAITNMKKYKRQSAIQLFKLSF